MGVDRPDRTYENTKYRGNWGLEYVGIQISEYRSSTAG